MPKNSKHVKVSAQETTADIFQLDGIELILGDVFTKLAQIPDDSVDLVIADPPYGASSATPAVLPENHGLKGFGGAWKAADHSWDFLDPADQLNSVASWLSELKRIVKPEGSIWIHGSYHNLGFANVVCQSIGLEIINEVIWFKRNAMPNLRGTRLTASHEGILWVHKGGPKKRKYNFNYEAIKSADYPEDSFKTAGKQMRTVWDIPNNKTRFELSFGSHPTQKPERLIQRIVDIAGVKGGTLLSPFAGSGTDLVVAMRNGMKGIGIELEEGYFDLASRRLIGEAERLKSQLPLGNSE